LAASGRPNWGDSRPRQEWERRVGTTVIRCARTTSNKKDGRFEKLRLLYVAGHTALGITWFVSAQSRGAAHHGGR